MWIQSRTPSPSGCAETASSKSRAVAGSTVKVARSRRSRRASSPASAASAEARASASSASSKPRSRPRSSNSAPTTSRARSGAPSTSITRVPRACGSTRTSSPPRTRGPPVRLACGPRSNSGSTTRNRPRRPITPTNRLKALGRAPAAPGRGLVEPSVRGSSATRTSGLMPSPAIEVPSAVRYWPMVRSRAPPAASGSTSWNVPLPNVRVPTIVAEVVLLERRGEDLRRRGGIAVDQDHGRAGLERVADRLVGGLPLGAALGRDDRALVDEHARGEHRLVEQPAAVAAQVEDQALGALAVQALDRRRAARRATPWLKVAKRT